MKGLLHLLWIALGCWILTAADDLPACQPQDFHYEYTECDSEGGRWRVSVPTPGKCIGGAPAPPVRGKGCDFTCDAGQYLDLKDAQTCKPCPPGQYSLGGGVRFDDWETLPSGFARDVNSFSGPDFMSRFGMSGRSHKGGHGSKKDNCTGAGWVTNNQYISALGEEDCYATLTYTANLVRAGDVRFEYQLTDKLSMLHFQVKNSECETQYDRHNNKYLSVTDEDQWKYVTTSLKSGVNILTWKVYAMEKTEGAGIRKPAMIKNIELMGIAYTSQCMKCPSGTTSKEGASECEECKPGEASKKGDPLCTKCDAATEYSAERASECKKRPACTVNDYYSLNSPCDSKNMTRKTYSWIEPKICLDSLPGSVGLPSPSVPEPCPPCNPGMEAWNNTCRFCPPNHVSGGAGPCEPCPGSTAPETGIVYKWWNSLPPNANLSAYCLSMADRGCASDSGWQPGVDHIHSGTGHADDVYLVLSLKVGGFRGQKTVIGGEAAPLAEVTFSFETQCTKDCSFVFMQQNDNSGTTVLQAWEKAQKRQAYSYKVVSPEPVTFLWAFQKMADDEDAEMTRDEPEGATFSMKDDQALIYTINVTNTLHGGAARCKHCPRGTGLAGCIPCAAGEYLESLTPTEQHCARCAPNTIARGVDAQSCVACGPGLHTTDNVRCETTCKLTSDDGKEYDFTSMAGIQKVEGTRLFTSGGTQYYHLFNISLCGGSAKFPLVQCADNITFPGESASELSTGEIIQSTVCRSTIIPPMPEEDNTMSAQPVSLADTLVSITTDGKSLNMSTRMEQEGFTYSEDDMDVHFVYMSHTSTAACESGRTTVITLRCDPTQPGAGAIRLPPKCSDGTCDGCNFHLVWHSKGACPVCKKEEYRTVPGQCVDGVQNITLIPPKHCILVEDSKMVNRQQKCSVKWPLWLTVVVYVVPLLVILVVFFIILAIYCCLRNRSLEYKYMKLIASSGNAKDGHYDELPAADSCGLEDGEDEDYDTVGFRDAGGHSGGRRSGNSLLNKLKGMGGGGKKAGDQQQQSLLDNLRSVPLGGGRPKKYGVLDPDVEELFSEEEINAGDDDAAKL